MMSDEPVIPVGLFVGVELRNVHVLTLPGRLVVRKISPLHQVMNIVLLINTDTKTDEDNRQGQQTRTTDEILGLCIIRNLALRYRGNNTIFCNILIPPQDSAVASEHQVTNIGRT